VTLAGSDIAPLEAVHGLWRAGVLRYLLHDGQVEVRSHFSASQTRIFACNMSRRWGKSWLACVIAVEQAIRQPRSQIRIAAPTRKMVTAITLPHLRDIMEDAPPDLAPEYKVQDAAWVFPNGSEIHAAGCDGGGAERLRGVSTDLAIVDEAGFVDGLSYVVNDVLLPQTITTGGRLLLVSTPPRSPAHPFRSYCERADAVGSYLKRTIHDAPHVTPELVEEYCRESGGVESTTWRREYLAEFVTDEERAVIPEFQRVEKEIVLEVEPPPYRDCYVSLDVGFYDLSFCVLGYLHFDLGKLVIEDEVVLSRSTSQDINRTISAKQQELWGEKAPLSRIVDASAITIADLGDEGGGWCMARKDDRIAALSKLRVAIANREILIHPRCSQLISHLRHATWNKSRTSYERSADHGHFDGVDALKYLIRGVDFTRSPYPDLPPGVTLDNHHINPEALKTKTDRNLVKLVSRRRKQR